MDKISLTDLRRQFFGPTLDESLLYGVDCLMDLFGVNRDGYLERQSRQEVLDRMSLKRSVSDLNMFESCRDVSLHGEESSPVRSLVGVEDQKNLDVLKRESTASSTKSNNTPQDNVSSTSTEEKISKESSKQDRISGKKRSINSSLSSKEPSKSSRSNKLFSSSEQSRKTKSSSTGSSKILEKLKKELANSYIFETKTNPSSPPRGRHSPRASRPTTLRSLSTPPPKAPSRRPKLIRTRWAIVKVNEFDDSAKTYEILQTDQHSADDVDQLKNQLVGAGADLPPEMITEIVFANLPDGSTLSYRLGSEKLR
ncbi:uncharacterized protein LOC135715023 [Ochlerotatus camptorhynchus]|uniref:uncharacterized protein LOC135715023 n=1 Tax=Ochlerotatus camptorhynchus TaxID=644619 RepID=UPI0031DADB6C